jgi:hypothetical protein
MGDDAVCFEVREIESNLLNIAIGQAATIGYRPARRRA